MRRVAMTPKTIDLVAERFRALGEPARLNILQALRAGERCVGELETDTGLNQANLSRHLQVLAAAGLVRRRKDGLFVHYALADANVLRLCELMCGRVKAVRPPEVSEERSRSGQP
jgi:DNA-binding transcriptional ArsR family regulator